MRRASDGTGAWRGRLAKAAVWVILAAVMLFFCFPLYWIVLMSIKMDVDIYSYPPKFFGFTPTLDNFRYVLHPTQPYLKYLLNSVIVAVSVTVLAVTMGALTSYALSRYRFRFRGPFMFWILTSRILPPVAVGLPLYLILRQLGLVQSFPAVILGHLTFVLPMAVWILKTFFDDIPFELEEAARIDGCSPWGAFWRIAFPLVSPGISAAAILSAVFSWNEFFYSLILTGTSTRTMPVAVAAFRGAMEMEWGKMAAASVLTIAPLIVFVMLTQRLLIRGLTGGAVKA